jgi:undecaprenyl-diphosphatase
MDMVQAIVIAIVQGATELFPVSSLAHAVLLPAVLRWGIDQQSATFLPFLVMLHVGTAVALVLYFWRDWLALALGVVGVGARNKTADSRRLLMLIIVATIPAVVVGFVLEHRLRDLFGAPTVAAAFLVVNAVLLLFGERLRRTAGSRGMEELTVLDAAIIGVWQCGALIPGISRSGATIVGGLLQGISHVGSARFSFLIATPIILGATVLEVPKLLHAGVPAGVLQLSVIAAVVAGVTAFLSTAFLMRYFRDHEAWALNPFAYYCVVAGLGCLAFLLI